MGKVASYDSGMFKVTKLVSTTHSTANVCLWSLHGYVLDLMHLLAVNVAERGVHIFLAILKIKAYSNK